MDLKTKLSELRKDRRLTQQELAEALNVSRQTVSRWEVGTVVPTLDNLMCLSRLYGVPLDGFMEGKSQNPGALEGVQPEDGEEPPALAAGAVKVRLLPVLLAVLLLGAGILIGMNLPRGEVPQNVRVDVNGPVGRLERTPTDIEDELEWLETAVKDLQEDKELP